MAFIQVRPDLLIGSAEMRRADHAITPSPRSWERVSDVWKNCVGKREREILICGLVGDSTAHEFLTVADELKHLASVEKIIATPRRQLHKVVPTTINGLYGMAYALAASVNAGNLSKIMNVVDALNELSGTAHNKLPLADLQALAGSLILERALKLGLDCGVDLPFEHATRAGRTGRIALAVDTSGSIDESLLRRFAAEVAAVLVKTEPLLRLIVCDADVHQIHDFSGREGAKLLRRFKFRGGGGTDFRPAIAEAAKWKPDLLIYLTDLQGDAGAEPAFPVLWAVPEGKAEAPWGKIVELR